jgi:chitinase
MIKSYLQTGAVFAAMFVAAPVSAATLITNGDFEGGDLTGWTCSVSASSSCDADTGSLSAHTGTYYMELFENIGVGSVTQTVATVAGQAYDFSFWSEFSQIVAANVLSYSLDGGAAQIVTPTLSHAQTTDSFVADDGFADITFFFETDGGTGIFAIDDVMLTAVSEVPLPASAPLLLAAVGGLMMRGRRKA